MSPNQLLHKIPGPEVRKLSLNYGGPKFKFFLYPKKIEEMKITFKFLGELK